VAVVGKLVQKKERDGTKGETIHTQKNTKSQNTLCRKQKYRTKNRHKKNIKQHKWSN
jgi:hypothetical protein